MELLDLIKDAEFNMFFMSGRGLGAPLAFLIALATVVRGNGAKHLFRAFSKLASKRKS